MTEDNRPTVSSTDSISQTDSCNTKQRKKRKWDVPAEPLVVAGLALPGNLPFVNGGSHVGITLPGIVPVSNCPVSTPLVANGTASVPGFQASLLKHAVTLAQKLNPPKIQDELIAREIVINDADTTIRYKLTKRQTQEEIQKSTGAVVITRGKYRPPNAPTDGEKPLYLHISAGSHLETTVERIKAVDLAAAMVEEMLKEGSVNNGPKVNHLLSTCVYLGFEADPSSNVYARIRGPNDQYINHIMNETGATVLLRGRGSGSEGAKDEEGQQPLHLFLSSYNPKSLEQAKLLAENLLDTISAEFGASRISSNKVYGAVPPPLQLLTGVQCSVNESKPSNVLAVSSTASSSGSTPAFSAVTSPGLIGVVPQGVVSHSGGGSSLVQSQPTTSCYPHSPLSSGTSYNGYAGIYPQATPLQQVALALRQPISHVTATVTPVTTAAKTETHTIVGSTSIIDKRPPHKRKFQELPAAGKGLTSSQQKSVQGSNIQKPRELTSDAGARHISMMPPAKNFVQPSSNGVMPPPKDLVRPSPNGMLPPPPPPPLPPKVMPQPPTPPKSMPPPPPKFKSPSPRAHENNNTPSKMKSESVPDTLVKLMEYGDDDDDNESEETGEESLERNSTGPVAPKPFWAV